MSEQSRTVNSARNIFWGVVLKLTALFLPFINRTVIIRTLGIEYSGIASLFTSILSVLSLAEMGINTAILFSMYKTIAVQDIQKTNALLALYKKAYRIIGIIVSGLGVVICFNIDFFIAGDYPSDLNIYVIFLLYLFSSVSSYFFFAYAGLVLTANQREDIIFKITIVVNLCRESLQLVSLIVFKNYYIYVLLLVFSMIVYNVLIYRVAKKRYPYIRAQGDVDKKDKKIIKKQIAGLVIGKLSVVSRNSFDSIIISSFLGLVPTAIYSNYYYIMNALFGLVYYFCSGLRASIGNKVATVGVGENYRDMLSFSYGFYVLYGTCTTCLLCGYQSFMKIWVGEEYVTSIILPLLMSFYFFLFCAVSIISQYWEAIGLFWENRYRFVLEAIINLALNIAFVQIWGINGVISATIVSMLISTNILGPLIAFKYYFKECSIGRYFLKQFTYLIVTCLVTFVCYKACEQIILSGILGLLIRCILAGFFSLSINIILFYKTEEFKTIVALIDRLLHHRIKISRKNVLIVSIIALVLVIISYFTLYFFRI